MLEHLLAVDRGELGPFILPRLKSSFRHRRSRHSVAAPAADFRRRRQRASVVSVVSRRSYAVCSWRCSPVTHHPSAVWCAAGIRSGAGARDNSRGERL